MMEAVRFSETWDPIRATRCDFLEGYIPYVHYTYKQTNKQTNSVALSPQANYTD
jgi:hypothetical protein